MKLAATILLLLCASAFGVRAQAFTPRRPFMLSSASGSSVPGDMALWLKPETVTTNADGTTMRFWLDSSGHGRNYMGNSGSGLIVTNNALNGYVTGYGTGGGWMAGTNCANVIRKVEGASGFAVIKKITAASSCNIIDFPAGTTFYRWGVRTTGASTFCWAGRTLDADTEYAGPSITFPSGWFLVEAIVGYTNGTIKVYTNGTLAVSDSGHISSGTTSDTDAASNARWGDWSGSGAKGIVSELLLYNRVITEFERTNNIEPYFKAKFLLW